MPELVYITRRETFNAAHRLYRPDWDDVKNLEVFGKCSNPQWHGHNYVLYVTVQGPVDPGTGFVVNLNLQSDIGLAFAQATQGLYDVSLLGNVADFPDPDGFSTLLDGSLPPAFTRSYGMDIPRITELLREGRSKIAPEDRKPIYDELQRVVAEEVPIAMLVSRYQGVAMRANVEGFSVLPGQTVFYSALRIEHASASGG